MKRNKKFEINNFIIGCIIGFLSFILLYGTKVLDVTYVDWLKNAGDLSQHYIGWQYFRNDPWAFPLGTISSLAYPFGVSITYMDSIPVFALIFKLFNGLLPSNFQYFGLWGAMCFTLSGGISSIILSKFTKNRFLVVICSLFFIFAPTTINKMFAHTALAGHWILLLAICIWVYKDKFSSLYINIITWTSITALSVLIHPYFTVMIFIILLGYCIQDITESKKIKTSILTISISIIITGIIFYIIGGFNGQSSPGHDGLGNYSMNFNAIFNPQGWSKILHDLPNATKGQYEGFQYLGLGILLMIPINIFLIIKSMLDKSFRLKLYIENNIKYIIPITVVFLISLFASLSPTVTINSKIIFNLNMPQKIMDLWSIFRSSGRLFWGMGYIIMIILIILIYKNIKSNNIKMILMIALISIQLLDMSHILQEKHMHFSNEIKYDSQLQSPIWEDISNRFEHIVFLPADPSGYDHFSYYATKHNMTLNTGYIAHGNYDNINNVANENILDLKNNNVKKDSLYIIKDKSLVCEMLEKRYKDIAILKVDGYDVLFDNSVNKINMKKYKDVYEYEGIVKKMDIKEYLMSLDSINDDEIVLFSSKDDVSNSINKEIDDGMKKIGLKESLLDKFRWSYCGYLTKDKDSYELLDNSALEFTLQKGSLIGKNKMKNEIIVKSAGSGNGNYSNIIIDGKDYSLSGRGLNFVIFDMKLNKVKQIASFDTYVGTEGIAINTNIGNEGSN